MIAFTSRSVTVSIFALALLAMLTTPRTSANSVSLTGNLANPESVVSLTLTVSGGMQTIDLQTWGFGGGTNAARKIGMARTRRPTSWRARATLGLIRWPDALRAAGTPASLRVHGRR